MKFLGCLILLLLGIFFAIFGILRSILDWFFGSSSSSRRSDGNEPYSTDANGQNGEDANGNSEGKVIGDDEGEYVHYEDIDDKPEAEKEERRDSDENE